MKNIIENIPLQEEEENSHSDDFAHSNDSNNNNDNDMKVTKSEVSNKSIPPTNISSSLIITETYNETSNSYKDVNINNTVGDSHNISKVTEVDVFLETYALSQYKYILRAEGYEDLADLSALAHNNSNEDLFRFLISRPGHRAKIQRLLQKPSNNNNISNNISQTGEHCINSITDIIQLPDIPNTTTTNNNNNNNNNNNVISSLDDVLPHNTSDILINNMKDNTNSERSSTATIQSQKQRKKQELNNNNKYNNTPQTIPFSVTPSTTSLSLFPPFHNNQEYYYFNNYEEVAVIKIVVVGQPGCGKTSFIHRLIHGNFNNNTKATLGVDFAEKRVRVGNVLLRLHFWDVWGQEYSLSATKSYYNQSRGAIIVYEANNRVSLEKAAGWKADIDAKVTFGDTLLPIPTILVGNKYDCCVNCSCCSSDSSRRNNNNNNNSGDVSSASSSISRQSTLSSINAGVNNKNNSNNNNNKIGHPHEGTAFKSQQEIQDFCNFYRFMGHFFTSAKTGLCVESAVEFLVSAILKMDPLSISTTDTHRVHLIDTSHNNNNKGRVSSLSLRMKSEEESNESNSKKETSCFS